MPPTRPFDEPVSISSVYNVAGIPTLMAVVYDIAVFVIEKLDACLPKLEVHSMISCYFGLPAFKEVTSECTNNSRNSERRVKG